MRKKPKKTLPKRTKREDKLIAYHEAGHAVMAYHKGGKFPSIHMDVNHLLPNVDAAVAPVKWPSGKGTKRNKGLYRLAGMAVVAILLKNPDEHKEKRNIDDLIIFCKLWETTQEQEKNFLELYSESINFFKDPIIWKQVKRLVKMLLKARILGFDEFKLCIDSVKDKKQEKEYYEVLKTYNILNSLKKTGHKKHKK